MKAVLWHFAVILLFSAYARGQFQVNTSTQANQTDAAVAAAQEGNFVVTWSSDGAAGGPVGIFARLFDPQGTAIGDEFRVDNPATANPAAPDVAMDPQGNFIVVWHGNSPGDEDIFARRFDANGLAIGEQFCVNNPTPYSQIYAKIAISNAGGFVIVWESERLIEDSSIGRGIKSRIYDDQAQPCGDVIEVNLSFNSYRPDVAIDDWGKFIIVWVRDDPDSSSQDVQVMARQYDDQGQAITGPFAVSPADLDSAASSSIGMAGIGNFVVVWSGENQTGTAGASLARSDL